MSLDELIGAQEESFRRREWDKEFDRLVAQFLDDWPSVVKKVESSQALKGLSFRSYVFKNHPPVSGAIGRDLVGIQLVEMDTSAAIQISSSGAAIKNLPGGKYLMEMAASVSCSEGSASCHAQVTADHIMLPLIFKVGLLLRDHYPKHQAASSQSPLSSRTGEYRMLWGSPSDRERLAIFLVEILRGESPQSDFSFFLKTEPSP